MLPVADGPILPYLQLPCLNRADCGTFKRSQQKVVPNHQLYPVYFHAQFGKNTNKRKSSFLEGHPCKALAWKYLSSLISCRRADALVKIYHGIYICTYVIPQYILWVMWITLVMSSVATSVANLSSVINSNEFGSSVSLVAPNYYSILSISSASNMQYVILAHITGMALVLPCC